MPIFSQGHLSRVIRNVAKIAVEKVIRLNRAVVLQGAGCKGGNGDRCGVSGVAPYRESDLSSSMAYGAIHLFYLLLLWFLEKPDDLPWGDVIRLLFLCGSRSMLK